MSPRSCILEFSVSRIKSNEHSNNRSLFFLFGSLPPTPQTIMSPKLKVRNLRGLESSFIIVNEMTVQSQSLCLQSNPPCALVHSTSVIALQVLNTSSLVYSNLFFSTFLASSLTFEELLGGLLSLELLSHFLSFPTLWSLSKALGRFLSHPLSRLGHPSITSKLCLWPSLFLTSFQVLIKVKFVCLSYFYSFVISEILGTIPLIQQVIIPII